MDDFHIILEQCRDQSKQNVQDKVGTLNISMSIYNLNLFINTQYLYLITYTLRFTIRNAYQYALKV